MDDFIKRSDAIKAIEDLPNAYNGWSDAYDKAYIIGTLEEVPSADRPQGWIPCSERLPKIGEVVLVTWEWGCKKYITIAYMVTIRGVTYWDSKLQHEFEPLNVLAWMPLPKPWRGANDEV